MERNISELSTTVVKSNFLINCNFNLTSSECKILSIAIAYYFRYTNRSMIFKISDIAKIMPVSKSNAYAVMKDNTRKMVGKSFEVTLENGDLLQAVWFSSIKYIHGKGLVEFNLNQDILPLLEIDSSKGFTRYELQYILPLQSKYGVRLYELLKQRSKIGKRRFTIKDFRAEMNIPDDIYQKTGDMIIKVVKVCQAEFDEFTDIKFKYDTFKVGRAITHIEFRIFQNHKVIRRQAQLDAELDAVEEIDEAQNLYNELASFNLSAGAINKIMKTYELDYILERMEAVDEYVMEAMQNDKDYNTAALLVTALKEGWNPKGSDRYEADKKAKEQKKVEAKRIEDETVKIQHLEKQYDTYIYSAISLAFINLDDEEQMRLRKDFQKNLPSSGILSDVTISSVNLEDKSLISNFFSEYLKEHIPGVEILSFEAWCENNTKYRVTEENGEWKLLT